MKGNAECAPRIGPVADERNRSGQGGDAEEDQKEKRVGLAQRAWPMLEMMKRAVAEKADIVWGA